MSKTPRLHLFQAYGIELEYMIVDADTLNIRPISDKILIDQNGKVNGEIDHGEVGWSNELVSHVMELKSNGPKADLTRLKDDFNQNIVTINDLLKKENAVLMPGAAHPWMDPSKETVLWWHDSQEIYKTYDRIFSCKGHGWSNLQSMHIDLPFYDDEEFAKLHTAIRFILPIIPALTAASPILDRKFSGYLDKRLFYYEKNQSRIPAITGKVIPERVFSLHGYQKKIYERITKAISPYDTDHLLKPVWLNSRGAIARFDRGAIEIRVIDIQECPSADLAVAMLIIHLLKLLTSEKWISFSMQQSFETDDLYHIFKDVIIDGGNAGIGDENYVKAWKAEGVTDVRALWAHIVEMVVSTFPSEMHNWTSILSKINSASLAERILKSLNGNYTHENLRRTYGLLVESLGKDRLFEP